VPPITFVRNALPSQQRHSWLRSIVDMNANESKQPSRSYLLPGVVAATALLVVCMLCMPNFVRSGTSKTNGIINNLRQLDGAKQQWALDHGRTGAVLVTTEDLVPYLRYPQARHGLVKPVAGEHYSIKTLIESPEAQLTREVDGRPKGTVIRLGTSNVDITGPTKD